MYRILFGGGITSVRKYHNIILIMIIVLYRTVLFGGGITSVGVVAVYMTIMVESLEHIAINSIVYTKVLNSVFGHCI